MTLQILTLLLASSLVNMSASAIAPILSALTEFFGNDPTAAHWVPDLITLPGLFTIISALATGWAIDHWGRLAIFRLGLIAYAIGGSSGAICSSIAGLFVGRIIIGIATGIILTTNTALIADYFSDEQRRKVISWQMCAIGIGGFTSVVLSGLLAGISWRLAFGLYLLAFIVLAFSYCLDEPQSPKIQPQQNRPAPIPFFIKKILAIILITGVFIWMPIYITKTSAQLSRQESKIL